MTILLTADLHLDDNPRNADRWNLFAWLKTQANKTGAKKLFILGDLTDSKDRHNSRLVNKLVAHVQDIAQFMAVDILKGNHDFIDESMPFFQFLSRLDGTHPISFITEPSEVEIDDGTHKGGRTNKPTLCLPCTKDWDANYGKIDFKPYKYIFAHQTFDGATSENGTALQGVSATVFAATKARILSGDIHVPQKIGNIEYIGAPYRIRFGDSFEPRVVLLRHGESSDLHYPGRGRELIEARSLAEIKEAPLDLGTQVKIRIKLKRAEYATWPEIKKGVQALVERRGWDLCGLELAGVKERDRVAVDEDDTPVENVDPQECLDRYAKTKKLGKPLRKAGRRLLKEAIG